MQAVVDAIGRLYEIAHKRLKDRVSDGGKINAKKLDQLQVPAHALAYLATEFEACKQLLAWSESVGGSYEKQIAATYIGDVGRSLRAHIDLGACEQVGMAEIGITAQDLAETILRPEVAQLCDENATAEKY